ncbi:MAG: hypothetical protein D3910_21320, partial [Candidatus Electrothrix sp. ATG2]|nr:hypothetical protein [Candidatus Electrothrix sp. ATG2]
RLLFPALNSALEKEEISGIFVRRQLQGGRVCSNCETRSQVPSIKDYAVYSCVKKPVKTCRARKYAGKSAQCDVRQTDSLTSIPPPQGRDNEI